MCLAEINIERGFYKFIDTCVIEELEDGVSLYNSFDRLASVVGSCFKENNQLGLIITRNNDQALLRFSITNSRLQIGSIIDILPQVPNDQQQAVNPAEDEDDNMPFPPHFIFVQDRRQQVNAFLKSFFYYLFMKANNVFIK